MEPAKKTKSGDRRSSGSDEGKKRGSGAKTSEPKVSDIVPPSGEDVKTTKPEPVETKPLPITSPEKPLPITSPEKPLSITSPEKPLSITSPEKPLSIKSSEDETKVLNEKDLKPCDASADLPKPIEMQSEQPKPEVIAPIEVKSEEIKGDDSNPVEQKSEENKTNAQLETSEINLPSEVKSEEVLTADSKPAEQKSVEGEFVQPEVGKQPEHKPEEVEPAQLPVESNLVETTQGECKPEEHVVTESESVAKKSDEVPSEPELNVSKAVAQEEKLPECEPIKTAETDPETITSLQPSNEPTHDEKPCLPTEVKEVLAEGDSSIPSEDQATKPEQQICVDSTEGKSADESPSHLETESVSNLTTETVASDAKDIPQDLMADQQSVKQVESTEVTMDNVVQAEQHVGKKDDALASQADVTEVVTNGDVTEKKEDTKKEEGIAAHEQETVAV